MRTYLVTLGLVDVGQPLTMWASSYMEPFPRTFNGALEHRLFKRKEHGMKMVGRFISNKHRHRHTHARTHAHAHAHTHTHVRTHAGTHTHTHTHAHTHTHFMS